MTNHSAYEQLSQTAKDAVNTFLAQQVNGLARLPEDKSQVPENVFQVPENVFVDVRAHRELIASEPKLLAKALELTESGYSIPETRRSNEREALAVDADMEQQVSALFGALHETRSNKDDATKDAAENDTENDTEIQPFDRLSLDDKVAVNYAARKHMEQQADKSSLSLGAVKNQIAEDPSQLEDARKQWQEYSSSHASRLQPDSEPVVPSR